jgi:hypothetical protein
LERAEDTPPVFPGRGKVHGIWHIMIDIASISNKVSDANRPSKLHLFPFDHFCLVLKKKRKGNIKMFIYNIKKNLISNSATF